MTLESINESVLSDDRCFRAYPKIKLIDKKVKKAAKAVKNGLISDRFYATEKLHGANFAIYTDGKTVRVARRGAFLAPGDSFMKSHWKNIVENMAGALDKLFKVVLAQCENSEDVKVVVLYGELCGKGIQTEVEYCETSSQVFHAFDLRIISAVDQCSDDEDDFEIGEVKTSFFGYEKFKELVDAAGISRVPEIACGTFEEMAAIDPYFVSKILNKEDNFAEGVVIRHAEDSLKMKNKSDQFSEVVLLPKKPKKEIEPVNQNTENLEWMDDEEDMGFDMFG